MVPSLNTRVSIFSVTLAPDTIRYHISVIVVPAYSWGTALSKQGGNIWLGQKRLPYNEAIALNVQMCFSSWSFLLAGWSYPLPYPGGQSGSHSPKVLAYSSSLQGGFQCWAWHRSLQSLTAQVGWCCTPTSLFLIGNTLFYVYSEKKKKPNKTCYYLNQYFLLFWIVDCLRGQKATTDLKLMFQ